MTKIILYCNMYFNILRHLNSVKCLSDDMRDHYIPAPPIIPFIEADDCEDDSDDVDNIVL